MRRAMSPVSIFLTCMTFRESRGRLQRRVRQMMDVWYGDGPLGIPGDDDGGETSSWYVLSAIGFYPVCPGSPVYEIGSPIFTKSTVLLSNGKEFTVVANGASAQNSTSSRRG